MSPLGEQVLHLLLSAALRLDAHVQAAAARRQGALRRTAGALTGSYPSGYLDQPRDDCPA